eukprot:TRINITY_DN27895_c0_g1_i1.p1 TRINITY_DN27895_c0_g1~~TRINITY_DN27895_c0_g1_i1.p1  ORF type:complete len:356 (-),score=44.23 TRINITY_DN27895_c0_g1_i1:69-1055(-)
MLHRCAASSHCCPKLHEEDFGAAFGGGPGPQLYSNPFFYEEGHAGVHFSMNGEEESGDFPPGALALMYDPPIEDDLDDGSESYPDLHSYSAGRNGLQGVALAKRSGPLGPQLRSPQLRPNPAGYPGGGPRYSAGAADDKVEDDFSQDVEKPWCPPTWPKATHLTTLEGVAHTTQSPGARRAASPGRPRDGRASLSPSAGKSSHGAVASTSFGPSSKKEELKPIGAGRLSNPDHSDPVTQQSRMPSLPAKQVTVTQTGLAAKGTGADQPRTFSRSIREAQACTSEAGAASIAAILQCVEQAEMVPEIQRPNSEKWSERLNRYNPQKPIR